MEKIEFENFNISGKFVNGIRAYYTMVICETIDEGVECFELPQEMVLGRNLPAIAQVIEHIYLRTMQNRIVVSKLIDFERI